MDEQLLKETAQGLVAFGKGLLAADESAKTAAKRFAPLGIQDSEESHRIYRQLLFTTPGAAHCLSGVILHDETFWQRTDSGQPFREYLKEQNIVPGIKVDMGLADLPGFPNEKVTQGLDGLPERMAKYAAAGAQFAKWRAVITIGEGIPTDEAIGANTYGLARYARICQEYNVVPIVEPEVLFEGTHTIEQTEATMTRVFDMLFQTMRAYKVYLPGAILKTSMVLPGKDSGTDIDPTDVADRTCRVLHHHVPHELGGIVFLSGGQLPKDAFINLNRIAQRGPHPWGVTFSYSRALQDAVLKAWAKQPDEIAHVQDVFHQNLVVASAASKGELDELTLENDTFVSNSQD